MADTWSRIGDLFDAARGRPADEREAWVRSSCEDGTVVDEVLALLRAYEDDPAFLEQPLPAGTSGAAIDEALAQPVAQRGFGPYRLIREIGRGGMGVVFEAEHTDGEFSRRVAIKVVPSVWSAASLTARFRFERQVLARLDHPGIARLLDAGTTEEGTPFFVMEYVDGQPIDVWCRDHALSVRQRIELFLRVSEAVEHAHRNLVVHRDLKAAHILVSADGQPKLLDFGIAKMLSEEAESRPALTETGQQVFTPGYASPEQIRGEGVTTASDVYSLGVLLYVVLTGNPPYDISRLSTLAAMRTVCEVEPKPPSTVAPLDVRRMLKGDLDNILLLALRKDPRERYPSVRALADDLRAWMDGRPVSASPATRRYRARKLVARHKAAAAGVAAVVLALAAGGVTTAWQAHAARIERDKAQSRFREVRLFSRSLLFELHDSIAALPGSTPSRRLLLSKAVEFLDGLSADAGDDRALKLELGEGYRKLGQVQGSAATENLGDPAAAIASLHKATRLGEDVLASDPHSVTAAILLTGAYNDLADSLLQRGEIAEAERAYGRHRAIVGQLENTRAPDGRLQATLAASYSNLARFRGQRKDWSGAKAMYRKSIDLYESLPPAERTAEDVLRTQAFALKRLGAVLVSEGQLEEGEARYQAALALDEQQIALHPDNARYRYDLTFSLTDLAFIAGKRGDDARAESLWKRALAIRQAALAADPANTRTTNGVANLHMYLGEMYRKQKLHDLGISQFRESLRLRGEVVRIIGPLPGPVYEQAYAQMYLAQALLDIAAAGTSGEHRYATVSEARQLLKLAEAVGRKPAPGPSPSGSDLAGDVRQQLARLRRFGG